MNRCAVVLASTLALVAAQSAATAQTTIFPPEVISAAGEHGLQSFPEKLDEPALWAPGASGVRPHTIRMFIGGHTIASWSIRLEQSDNGRWVGYFREHDGRRLKGVKRFRVRDDDFRELQALTVKSGLWGIYPEFWARPEGTNLICVDGMTIVFERADTQGYRFSQGNAQCTLADSHLAVAAKLMQMARRSDLERLLY